MYTKVIRIMTHVQGSGSAVRHRRKRHTVADIEQLRTPKTGVEEAPQGIPAVISKMPLVDLTALAPEKQQAVNQVTEGWKEGTTNTKAEPMPMVSIRDITQKIHGTTIYLP